jgi:hypothetical protein
MCPGKWNRGARGGRKSELFRSEHERDTIEQSELAESRLAVGVHPTRIAAYGAKLGGFHAEQFRDQHGLSGLSRWNYAEHWCAATTNVKRIRIVKCGLRPAFPIQRCELFSEAASFLSGKKYKAGIRTKTQKER